MNRSPDPVLRLQLAMDLLRRHRETPGAVDSDLLDLHPELRDVLEPLLAGAGTRALLDSLEELVGPLDHPLEDRGPTATADPGRAGRWLAEAELPREIAGFEILRELGAGGMGVVYLAAQREPVRRLVALKRIRLGRESRQTLARFHAERQALARMSHPHVARVLEAGETDDGLPWLAMEFVPGEPITVHCDRVCAAPSERLRLFLEVCEGVNHAHQRALIHRDLKPSNVQVTERDGRATAVVLDFGIAKPLDEPLAERTLTAPAAIVGTPDYMSPEQLEPGREVDIRTDVHALGILLHELLVGVHPFDPAAGAAGDREPMRPSAMWSRLTVERRAELARRRSLSPAALGRQVRGDLGHVIWHALARDPERRYPNVAALADDVRRAQRLEPVRARRPSRGYLLRRALRRNGRLVAVTLAILLLLVAATVVSLGFAAAEREARLRYTRVASLVRLERALEREAELFPAWPEQLDALRSWIDRDGLPLAAMLEPARRALDEVRATAAYSASGSPRFGSDEDEFLHGNLQRLVAGLEELSEEVLPRVQARAAWAASLQQRSLEAPAELWETARTALQRADGITANAAYADMPPLVPQLGLVPIGRNPATKLWEFAHLASGAAEWRVPTAADYDADGRLRVTDASGIVFVLVPPGDVDLGSPRSDAFAQADEQPRFLVGLDAFFIARHELTRAQWRRLAPGSEDPSHTMFAELAGLAPAPSHFGGQRLTEPLNAVSWRDATAVLTRHRLTLPSEAQWEYACRGGSTTRWWTGDDRESLRRDGLALNIADRRLASLLPGRKEPGDWPDLDDGHAMYAPPDGGRINGFGLHWVCGNVFEFCLDRYAPSYRDDPPRDGDGHRADEDPPASERVIRGGSFASTAGECRSANRNSAQIGAAVNQVGVRVARRVMP